MRQLLTNIHNGEYDDEIDELLEAVLDRKKHLRAVKMSINAATIKIGSRVQLSGNIRPKYMAGLTGTVNEKKGRKLLVQLDVEGAGRFGNLVWCPANILEPLSEKKSKKK